MRDNEHNESKADSRSAKKNKGRRKRSTEFRLSQSFVLTLAVTVCVGLISYIGLWALAKIAEVRAESDFEERIEECADYITYAVNSSKAAGYDMGDSFYEVKTMAYSLSGRVLIIDTSYTVAVDTYSEDTGRYLVDKDVYRVMTGADKYVVRQADNLYEKIFPIVNSEGYTDAVAVLAADTEVLTGNHNYILSSVGYLLVISLILGIVVAVICARLSVRDVKRVKSGIENMKGGNLVYIESDGMFKETHEMTSGINDIFNKAQLLEESRQEFVSNVSHELKTPITSMKVLSESLLTQVDVPAETYREFMEDIAQEIDREAEIISDLLTLVKTDKGPDSLNKETVDMNEFMELILKRLRPLAEKRSIQLSYESFREVSADIDKVKFTLAISNLIENGIKYNVDGGWIRVSLNADNRSLYIKVADSGVGIPEDCIDRIFERFYRVDKARSRDTGGTGLGLAISKNIILLHGGNINVYSEPGKGTTFTVKVPLVTQ